jgi:hypothetical protein
VHSVSFTIGASEYLAGWRERSGVLFLPTLSDCRVGDEVAIRLGIHGNPIRATLFGKVALVRKLGRRDLPPGVELQLERQSLPAARFLAMASRGEPVTFHERVPRWTAQRRIHLVHGGTEREVTTLNVSEGGCAVAWRGPLPPVGDELSVRVKEGLFAPSFRAVVCWTHGGPLDNSVGLKVAVVGLRARSWRAFVAGIARSGAPAA